VRQAIFDMLMHAPWGGRDLLAGAPVLDAFAGTGAFGLEALSRGAAHASFMERDRAALTVLRANIAACRAEERSTVLAADAFRPPRGAGIRLAFLDPPYAEDAIATAVSALGGAGWIAAGAVLVAESDRTRPVPALAGELLAERSHGAALVTIWRF
jgi:16S rRNA (guanine966-N2)-methyltransferase